MSFGDAALHPAASLIAFIIFPFGLFVPFSVSLRAFNHGLGIIQSIFARARARIVISDANLLTEFLKGIVFVHA